MSANTPDDPTTPDDDQQVQDAPVVSAGGAEPSPEESALAQPLPPS